jgi:methionyl-tRNA formyltransferase
VLKIHSLQVLKRSGKAGSILEISKDGVLVGTLQDAVLLGIVQPPSKPKMSAHDWANGYRIKVGDEFLSDALTR